MNGLAMVRADSRPTFRKPTYRRQIGGLPVLRTHRSEGQSAVPRRDDVRRVGQPRPRRVDPDHPPRARRGHQLHRHRRRLLARASRRRSSARRWPAAGATTSSWRPRSTARWATTRTSAATRAAGSSARSRTACAASAPTTSTCTRSTGPTRDTDIDETLGALTDLVRAGQDPLHRLLDVPGEPDRRGAVGRRAARTRAVRRASSRRTRSWSAAIEADVLPTCERYGMGVIPWSPLAGGWLTGRYRKDARRCRTSPAADAAPGTLRPVAARATRPSSTPSTRSRSWPTRPGCRLIDLALAFVLEHPAVTAAIIGPRTMEQLESQLGRRTSCPTTCSTGSTRSSRPA